MAMLQGSRPTVRWKELCPVGLSGLTCCHLQPMVSFVLAQVTRSPLRIPHAHAAHIAEEECAIKTRAIEQLIEDEVRAMEREFVWLLFGQVSTAWRRLVPESSAAPAEAKVREMLQELEDCSILSPPAHLLEHSLRLKDGYNRGTRARRWVLLVRNLFGNGLGSMKPRVGQTFVLP